MKILIELMDKNFLHVDNQEFEVSDSYYELATEAAITEAENKLKDYTRRNLEAKFGTKIEFGHRAGNDFVDIYLPCKVYDNGTLLQDFSYRLTAFPLENEKYPMRKILTNRK